MEKILIIVAALFLAVLLTLFILGYRSSAGVATGLIEGRLRPCPDKPNCVNSEFVSDTEHYIEPLVYSADDAARVLPRLKTIIGEMGGNIEAEETNYLAVTFTSSIFRFVDDLEIRIDSNRRSIHLRSASRVGYGDAGINRKRVGRLKNSYYSVSN